MASCRAGGGTSSSDAFSLLGVVALDFGVIGFFASLSSEAKLSRWSNTSVRKDGSTSKASQWRGFLPAFASCWTTRRQIRVSNWCVTSCTITAVCASISHCKCISTRALALLLFSTPCTLEDLWLERRKARGWQRIFRVWWLPCLASRWDRFGREKSGQPKISAPLRPSASQRKEADEATMGKWPTREIRHASVAPHYMPRLPSDLACASALSCCRALVRGVSSAVFNPGIKVVISHVQVG